MFRRTTAKEWRLRLYAVKLARCDCFRRQERRGTTRSIVNNAGDNRYVILKCNHDKPAAVLTEWLVQTNGKGHTFHISASGDMFMLRPKGLAALPLVVFAILGIRMHPGQLSPGGWGGCLNTFQSGEKIADENKRDDAMEDPTIQTKISQSIYELLFQHQTDPLQPEPTEHMSSTRNPELIPRKTNHPLLGISCF